MNFKTINKYRNVLTISEGFESDFFSFYSSKNQNQREIYLVNSQLD